MKKIYFLFINLLYTGLLFSQAPNFDWVATNGGSSETIGVDVSTDLNGNSYNVGIFNGTVDFDPGIGNLNFSSPNDYDIYVQKLDPLGNLSWAYSFGNNSNNSIAAVMTDSQLNLYLAGNVGGSDIDPGLGVVPGSPNGSFILKLDSIGNYLMSKNIAADIRAMTLDDSSNIYAIGNFSGNTDFDPGSGSFMLDGAVNSMFVLKLDAAGNFVWAKMVDNSLGMIWPEAVVIDPDQNVVLCGVFVGPSDFDPGSATQTLNSIGFYDGFTLKLNSAGNYLWAVNTSGMGDEFSYSVASDAQGNVYTVGSFFGTVDFDPNNSRVFNLNTNYLRDGFIRKLDKNGNLVWAKQIGGNNLEQCRDIKIQNGQINLLVSFNDSLNADPNNNSLILTSKGKVDVALLGLDTIGNFIWGSSFGGNGLDYGDAMDLDLNGNIFTCGSFADTADFDPGTGTTTIAAVAFYDAFIQKLSPITVGLEQPSNKFSAKLYPNPTSGAVQIQLNEVAEQLMIRLYTLEGKELIRKQYFNTDNPILNLEVKGGIYLMQLQSEMGTETIKVVVE